MKRTIIVRKKRSHRHGLLFLFLLLLSGSIAVCVAWAPYFETFLLLLCSISPLFLTILHYEIWKTVFTPKEIVIKRMFKKSKKFSYYQIKDAYLSYSCTEYEQINLIFVDGTCIRFRTEDENAGKALRAIRSHHSIRICHNLYRA